MTVTIVDYGMGNIGSIANMLKKLGVASLTSGDPAQIATAERIILPGVGAFDRAVRELDQRGLRAALSARVAEGVPLLGICLGMQLLADSSEEGPGAGLGWIPGAVRRLPAEGLDGPLRIPHMGWSRVEATPAATALPSLGSDGARYYFVHSYAFVADDEADVLGRSTWGHPFVAAVGRGSVLGVQFHPEKSHRHGMALLADFTGAR